LRREENVYWASPSVGRAGANGATGTDSVDSVVAA
jgi:hypothetical protein